MDKEFVNGMRKAGKLAARVLAHTVRHAVPGVSTNELDAIASDFTLSNGGTNACVGYGGYPKAICTSVNEVLCHGVPDDRCLRQDDTVNIDVTVKVGPYHGDCSVTVPIGNALPSRPGDPGSPRSPRCWHPCYQTIREDRRYRFCYRVADL